MHLPRAFVKLPTGSSFEVPDLMMLRAWADFHDLRITIDLDACIDGDEYEELVGIHDQQHAQRRWTVWRSADGIAVQPTAGRTMIFDCMGDVLEILIPSTN